MVAAYGHSGYGHSGHGKKGCCCCKKDDGGGDGELLGLLAAGLAALAVLIPVLTAGTGKRRRRAVLNDIGLFQFEAMLDWFMEYFVKGTVLSITLTLWR